MEINRDYYLEQIKLRMHNGMIKVITGVRRCGKSYLLFNIFYTYLLSQGINEDHIIKIPLDNIEYKEYRDANKLYNYIKSKILDKNDYYILLDEIQLVPDFEYVLNGLLNIEKLDTYVTGSNAKLLSKDIITEFRGRGDEIKLFPLSFKEFMTKYDGDKYQGLNDYMTYGGLPMILNFKTHEQKYLYLNRLFSETYIKDIFNRYSIKNEDDFNDLINLIASDIGALTNPTKIANTFRSMKKSTITKETVSKYLDYMEDAFLISNASRYDIKGKKYIGSPYKYYFIDLGLRNARLNFRQLELTHLMENLIYNELLIRGFNVDIGVVNTITTNGSSRQHKQLEVDFICNKVSSRYYIQSAYSISNAEKQEQEERPLIKIDDQFKKIIITRDMCTRHYTEDGILIMDIYDFLLDNNSLDY